MTLSQPCAGSAMWRVRSAWGTHALAPLSFRAASYSGIFSLLPLLTGEGRSHHGEILTEATRMAEAGQLSPSLDPRRFTLDRVGDAYHLITGGQAARQALDRHRGGGGIMSDDDIRETLSA
jgi:hypothetical protein